MVRLLTDHSSGPVRPIGPGSNWTGIEPFEPTVRLVNRTNWPILSEPNSSFSFLLPYAIGTPIVTWSVVRPTTVPLLLLGASSCWQHPRRWEPHPTSPATRWKALPTSIAPNANHVTPPPMADCKTPLSLSLSLSLSLLFSQLETPFSLSSPMTGKVAFHFSFLKFNFLSFSSFIPLWLEKSYLPF